MNIYDEITKKVFEIYNNEGLPINIVGLAKAYRVKTVIFKKDNETLKFKSKMIVNENKKHGEDIDFVICLNTNDALEQRMLVAYHVSALILFFEKKIMATEVIDSLTVIDLIPNTNIIYKMALCLLCPLKNMKALLTQNGINKDNYRDISNYNLYSKSFLISTVDFVNRLQLYFEGDYIDA